MIAMVADSANQGPSCQTRLRENLSLQSQAALCSTCNLLTPSSESKKSKHIANKAYAKLPVWFTFPTPPGSYKPDWAVPLPGHNCRRIPRPL